jgi:hypothetical protein
MASNCDNMGTYREEVVGIFYIGVRFLAQGD